MVTRVSRDYRLSGIVEGVAIALDDDQIEDRVEAAWWHPTIPRQELKALMQRRDEPALWHFGIWIVLLVVSGYAAVLSWGTWWAIPAFLIFGTIYSSSDARWHECGHGTPFKTRWLNELFYHVSSFMTLREAYLWRWSHARHHTHTYVVGLDPEIQVMRPADLLKIAMDFLYLRSGPPEVWRIIRHAFGNPTADVRSFVPASELPKMYWSSRVYVAIFVLFGLWSLAIGSFLPMMFIGLPRFYGGWLHQLLGLTQHAGLKENVFDHRQNTRTVYVNPVFRYLYMNMNYHIEHHSTPMVPYHALHRLHETIKDQTPTAYPNLWAVYKEMIPALIKQATENPDYHIVRDIPATPTPQPTPVNGVSNPTSAIREESAAVATAYWIDACDVADLDENDVIGLNHNGKAYAIYRLRGDQFYASDGLCTHGKTELAGGLIINGCIECPKHNGRFDVTTGKAVTHPVRVDLKTYPAERRHNRVFVHISEFAAPASKP
jgi:MocE subfamily Rieske [2Fe-2S] domain protein